MIKLTEKNGRISVETPYNAKFVRFMKEIWICTKRT